MTASERHQISRTGALAGMVALGLALFAAPPAEAATTYHVAPGGAGGECTLAEPCNIVFALQSAGSGDTVRAAGDAGTYGLPNSPTAAPMEVPAGATLEGEPGQAAPVLYTEANGLAVELGTDGRLVDLVVHDSKPGGTAVFGGAQSTVERVLTTSAGSGCIVAQESSVLDSACSGAWGLYESLGGGGQTIGLQLRNDTFYGTQQGALFAANNMVFLPEAVNTIFLGAHGSVLVSLFTAATVEVAATHSSYSGVIEENGATMTPEGTLENQTAAPLLADPAAGDFRELSGSPTIDAGLESPANGSLDLAGNPRALPSTLTCAGAGPAITDIGAYEYVAPQPVCGGGGPPAGGGAPASGGSGVSAPPSPVSSPPPTCTVPNLSGRGLRPARRRLQHADCALGKVKLGKGVDRRSGKVVKQRPKPGAVRAAGTKVRLTLG